MAGTLGIALHSRALWVVRNVIERERLEVYIMLFVSI